MQYNVGIPTDFIYKLLLRNNTETKQVKTCMIRLDAKFQKKPSSNITMGRTVEKNL